jgi:hypothetical protein
VKCCGTLSGQVCHTLTSSVSQESGSVTIVTEGDGDVFHTHTHTQTQTQNISVRYAETENVQTVLLYDKSGPEQIKQGK